MPKKRMPAAERQQETGTIGQPPPGRLLADNWPDTGPVRSGRESALTWAGEPLNDERTEPPEPKDKLDT